MKHLLILLSLALPFFKVYGKEIETAYFKIDLPEYLVVEASEDRVLAYGKNGPYSSPYHFLAIEFGFSESNELIKEKVSRKISQMDDTATLKEVDCGLNCTSYFASASQTSKEGKVLNGVFSIVIGSKFKAIISYATMDDLRKAESLVKKLSAEISGRST